MRQIVKALDRELGQLFYTFYEVARGIGFRRFAPFLAVMIFVVVSGVALIVALDVIALGAGRVSYGGISRAPRSVAGAAILGGYFIWDQFASPERIALLESLDATSPPERRVRRRVKTLALVVVLAAAYLALTDL
jgi:multidrug transporter EmrE-like cation transporter